jgi:hypothetical protein
MRRFLLALAVTAVTLAVAGSASATTYSTGTNFVRYDTRGRATMRCSTAALAVVGSGAGMSYSTCVQAGIAMIGSCATASYTSTLLSSINCVFSTSGSSVCNPGARVIGSSPLSGLITVLNSGQSLTATIPATSGCETIFGLAPTDPHTVTAHWGSATDGTGNIPFV